MTWGKYIECLRDAANRDRKVHGLAWRVYQQEATDYALMCLNDARAELRIVA